MSAKTSIEWTATVQPDGTVTPGATWNPIVGCTVVSAGCQFCYAETLHNRRYQAWQAGQMPNAAPQYHLPFEQVQLKPERLEDPFHWRAPRRVFVNSVSDLFHKDVPIGYIDYVWSVMALTPQHTYQVLTKRPRRMLDYLKDTSGVDILLRTMAQLAITNPLWKAYEKARQRDGFLRSIEGPLPNVWLGTSIELDRFSWRAKVLAEIPVVVRFISAEPLLGPLPSLEFGPAGVAGICFDIDGDRWHRPGERECQHCRPTISWLIVGGESGGPPERRLVEPCDEMDYGPDGKPIQCWDPPVGCAHCRMTGWRVKPEQLGWVRDLRDRASAAGVAFFFKQYGGPTAKSAGRELDGRVWGDYPT